jgi:hypothetical protein
VIHAQWERIQIPPKENQEKALNKKIHSRKEEAIKYMKRRSFLLIIKNVCIKTS